MLHRPDAARPDPDLDADRDVDPHPDRDLDARPAAAHYGHTDLGAVAGLVSLGSW